VFLATPEADGEIETLVRSWGQHSIARHPDGAMSLPDGRRLNLVEGEIDSSPIAYAVLIRDGDGLTGARLFSSIGPAASFGARTAQQGLTAEVTRLLPMPAADPARLRPRWKLVTENSPAATVGLPAFLRPGPSKATIEARLISIAALMAAAGSSKEPASELSDEICPRCRDHPLRVDSSLDVVSPDGERICPACVRLKVLRDGGIGRASGQGSPS
jgi:hypothetical protein